MIGRLPTSLEVGGTEFEIRSNAWDILNIIQAYNDPEMTENDIRMVVLIVLYPDYEDIPNKYIDEALEKASKFIDCDNGFLNDKKKHNRLLMPATLNWEQDEVLIFNAINKVAGREVRNDEYVHWWTLYGWLMEIPPDSVLATVMRLRYKKATHQNLDKQERQFWKQNYDLCELKKRRSKAEQEKIDRLKKMLD